MICPHCGAQKESTFERGPLKAVGDPPRIYCDGKPLRLVRLQADALALLIRYGRVSHERMSMLSRTRSAMSMKVSICQLRRDLPAGIGIYTDHGWGYVLDVGDTPRTLPKRARARLGM